MCKNKNKKIHELPWVCLFTSLIFFHCEFTFLPRLSVKDIIDSKEWKSGGEYRYIFLEQYLRFYQCQCIGNMYTATFSLLLISAIVS